MKGSGLCSWPGLCPGRSALNIAEETREVSDERHCRLPEREIWERSDTIFRGRLQFSQITTNDSGCNRAAVEQEIQRMIPVAGIQIAV